MLIPYPFASSLGDNSGSLTQSAWYDDEMDHLSSVPHQPMPQETSQDIVQVTIPEANAIKLAEALMIARKNNVAIGKSTLQRWAKVWAATADSPVKAVLQVTRDGRHYEIDRDDFEAWLLQEAENRPTLPNLAEPDETPQDLERPHKTQRDPVRPSEASDDHTALAARVSELETENLQLKIDVGVRRELINQAKEEMDALQRHLHETLKENGALNYQLKQLPAPTTSTEQEREVPPVDNHAQGTPPAV